MSSVSVMLMCVSLVFAAQGKKDNLKTLEEDLRSFYKLTKVATLDRNNVTSPGMVFVIRKDGLPADLASDGTFVPSKVRNGEVSRQGGATAAVFSKRTTRLLIAGERVYLMDLDVKDDRLRLGVLTVEMSPTSGARQTRYRGYIDFEFPKDTMRTMDADTAKMAIEAVLLPEQKVLVSAPTQKGIVNQDIVKMIKAALAEDVVLNMIGNQPAQFAIAPDDLIALKNEGVSDKIIAAMVSKTQPSAPTPSTAPSNAVASPVAIDRGKPNDAQILAAIKRDPNRNNPKARTALVLSTTPIGSGTRIRDIDVTVTAFQLIQWGEVNTAGKYWPVELCVSGNADNKVIASIMSPRERAANGIPQSQQFQTKAQYRLFGDDFGDLKAEQILVNEWRPQDSVCPPGSANRSR